MSVSFRRSPRTPSPAPESMSVPTSKDGAASPAGATSPAARPTDLVWQLWFEQFRQLGWLAVTAAAGTLLLDERDYLKDDPKVGVAVFLFALAAGISFIGQDNLVDHLTEGRSIERGVRMARAIAGMLIGIGGGVLLAIVFQ
jgi:hypothetical protein